MEIRYRFILSAFCCLSCWSPVSSEVYVEETFKDNSWMDKWIYSRHSGRQYGVFVLTAGKFYNNEEADKGIQTSEDARFYALSYKFTPFSNRGKHLVIQFSVKHEQSIDCGGGYVKVFDCSLEQNNMHGESPYLLMFGPDICGSQTRKVQVVLNYRGRNCLIKKDIKCQNDIYTHFYTLVISPDNSYEVLIDNITVAKGILEDDWDLLAPKKINDPSAKKPIDWDNIPLIIDPNDTKPENWEQPELIPDQDAVKPADWDNELDGEWTPPLVDNPDYKKPWSPRKIKNPNYQGEWVPPTIDNPAYEPDEDLYKRDEICAIGLDLWQVKSGSIFDNFLITDDVKYARNIAGNVKEIQNGERKMKESQINSSYDDEDEDMEGGGDTYDSDHDEL